MWWYTPWGGEEDTPTHARTLTDPVGITDSLTVVQGIGQSRTVTDPVGITDSIAVVQGVGHQRVITDPVGITDSIAGVIPWIPPTTPVFGIAPIRLRSADPLSSIAWFIDDKPVFMGRDWSAPNKINAGFDTFRGRILEEDLRRLRPGTFSIVRGRHLDGTLFWEGRISRKPKVYRGIASIEAQGHFVRAEKADTRLTYATRDYSLFGLAEAPPHSVTSGQHEKFGRQAEHNCLRFSMDKGNTYNGGEQAALAAGCAGSPGGFTRIKFDWVTNFFTDRAWHIYTDDYPATDGTVDVEATINMTANTGSVSQALTGPSSRQALVLFLEYVGATGEALFTTHYLVKNLVLNGIATGDTMVASATVADILTRLGIDTTLVDPTTQNVLPYDVREQSWSEALTYLAGIEDRWWGVWGTDGGALVGEFSGWERVWTTDRNGCEDGLESLEPVHRVVVKYPDPAGTIQEVVVEVASPPSGVPANEERITLNDVQADATVATAIANKRALHHGSDLSTGTLVVHRVRDGAGRGDPRKIRAGDLIRIADGDNPEQLHRVYDADPQQPDKSNRLTIEVPNYESAIGRIVSVAPEPELPEEDDSSGFGSAPSFEAPGIGPVPGEEAPPSAGAPSPGSPSGGGGAQHHEHDHGTQATGGNWHHGEQHPGTKPDHHAHWHPAGQHH